MSFQEVMGYQNNSHFTSFVLWGFLFFHFSFFFTFLVNSLFKKMKKGNILFFFFNVAAMIEA